MSKKEFLTDMIDKSINWRGVVLHEISLMEMMMNLYLAEHFCGKSNKERLLDMQLLILGDERINLMAKAEIFHYISKNYDFTWYNSYKSLRPKQIKKPEYTLNQDIAYCIEQRNIFAHRVFGIDNLPIEKERPENAIRFVRMKNEIIPVDITDENFVELRDTIHHIAKTIQARINQK